MGFPKVSIYWFVQCTDWKYCVAATAISLVIITTEREICQHMKHFDTGFLLYYCHVQKLGQLLLTRIKLDLHQQWTDKCRNVETRWIISTYQSGCVKHWQICTQLILTTAYDVCLQMWQEEPLCLQTTFSITNAPN